MTVWIFIALFFNNLEIEVFTTKPMCEAAVIEAKERHSMDTFCTERTLKRDRTP